MYETSGKFTRAKKAESAVDLAAIFEAIHWREFKILLEPEAFLHPRPKRRSERFHRLPQRETGAWVELGTTRTGLSCALSGKKLAHDE